jgi:Uncharacterized protein conserved in bacteria (DUF2325)
MSTHIPSDLTDNRLALSLLDAPNAASAALPLKSKPLPETAERELSLRVRQILAPPSHGRRKLWEFDSNLHCSIIGTCLTNAELRHDLAKLGLKEAETATEHDLHKSGVVLAGKRHDGAKVLQKALDRRHRVAINQLARAKTSIEVRTLWQEAVQRGEIPGAYWAALTHPATNEALVREIFSEVHMLSHLVGAANRADIRRLRQLEAENAELQAKVQRQQLQLRNAIVARDATIRELTRALEESLGQTRRVESAETAQNAAWGALAADLKSRLWQSESRRDRIEQELAAARSELSIERDTRTAAEQREVALRREVDAIETTLATAGEIDSDADLKTVGVLNATLLYVGGRPAQIAHLRALAERRGAIFLHHDGGIEERGSLLPGLVGRADAVLFPVDCVSHAAVLLVKRLCQQGGKPFVPLRSAGVAPFFAALQDPGLCVAKD